MNEIIEFNMPSVGDSKEFRVIEVLVSIGDEVISEQGVITIESDKASMEVPAPCAGIVKSVNVKVGDKISENFHLLSIEKNNTDIVSAVPEKSNIDNISIKDVPVNSKIKSEKILVSDNNIDHISSINNRDVVKNFSYASPSIRKFARELGVEISQVHGTGKKGRITVDDVSSFVKNNLNNPSVTSGAELFNLPPWPKIDFAQFGEIDSKPLSRIQKISGSSLHRNWMMIPHVTNNDEADITDLEDFRAKINQDLSKSNIKVTMLSFLVKALVSCLKKFPDFNASLDNDKLILKKYYNIGFAVDTPNGLMVPVIHNVDNKGVIEIASEIKNLSQKAREGKLFAKEMQGGCFSISSLGGIGGVSFTPIVNAPEVAILGVSKSAFKPLWDGKQFVPRLIMPISLSYDHRVIDGAMAAHFNKYLCQIMNDFRLISL
ncbi:dihydrolipoyllysine-residue acetyltransferase [Candidatus Kinetoplastidibacterium crithidiae]|uniref:Acetyltransferase component of pyruvate dehydrogenase complex n=1 Tax=Candidatus Kinetoplastidibacterium crithidiae TCC036E TaxID=1208918 RepID=M1LWI6_9PROT|nr:dihydrolipoyllysine-residue acetyltransferase [Candidatus Kinetoplastibacterium crithidii]AFZ82760.1 dihydrolipoamide acetyltransferase [Candidatus Kinetoplastibacterium crithidii (ex Angomonas deanei ATCC 30255)]AGF47589.1 pyruvate dehydrogenase E2 component [Candidatus Kinetoplastibacterium crithidii TCC036E]